MQTDPSSAAPLVLQALTQAQAQTLADWRATWSRIVRDTTPCDRPSVQERISDVYRAAHEEPPLFVWVQSPMDALVVLGILSSIGRRGALHGGWDQPKIIDKLGGSLICHSGPPPEDTFEGQLWRQLGREVWAQLHDAFRPLQCEDVSEAIWQKAFGELQRWPAYLDAWERLSDRVRHEWVLPPAGSPRAHDLARAAWNELLAAVKGNQELAVEFGDPPWDRDLWFGLADPKVADIARYAFCCLALPITVSEAHVRRLDRFVAVARSCGAWWPLQGTCIVSERAGVPAPATMEVPPA